MSFREAEATDPALSGFAAVLRAALEDPGYRRNPHQVYDSMDLDPLIRALPEPGHPASRLDLLRQVSSHRADPSTIPDEVVLFCRANLQQGPELPAAGTVILGRVQGLRSLVNAVAERRSARA